MEIQRVKDGDSLVLQLRGRLDAQHAGHLENEMEEVIRSGEHHVRLDMADVSFLSSPGIRVLLKYYQILRRLAGTFGVINVSAAVRSVLDLTGLSTLVGRVEAAPTPAPPQTGETRAAVQVEERQIGSLMCAVYPARTSTSLTCRLVGNPAYLETADFGADDVRLVELPKGTVGIGLGAFGDHFEDARARFGEFLGAGGAAAYLPTDGSKTPDYVVTTGSLIPRIQVLYAAVLEGQWARYLRFEAEAQAGRASLSHLARAGLDVVQAPTIGLVAIAESAGLMGASLKRSPVAGRDSARLFDHPEIRQWLSFTPEPVCDRSLVLLAGLVTTVDDPSLAPFVRPLGRASLPAGHFHAAAFTFKALPKGEISLEDTVTGLFEEKSLLGILHLINDTREITGAGESLFVRGAVWLGPVGSIHADQRRPVPSVQLSEEAS